MISFSRKLRHAGSSPQGQCAQDPCGPVGLGDPRLGCEATSALCRVNVRFTERGDTVSVSARWPRSLPNPPKLGHWLWGSEFLQGAQSCLPPGSQCTCPGPGPSPPSTSTHRFCRPSKRSSLLALKAPRPSCLRGNTCFCAANLFPHRCWRLLPPSHPSFRQEEDSCGQFPGCWDAPIPVHPHCGVSLCKYSLVHLPLGGPPPTEHRHRGTETSVCPRGLQLTQGSGSAPHCGASASFRSARLSTQLPHSAAWDRVLGTQPTSWQDTRFQCQQTTTPGAPS